MKTKLIIFKSVDSSNDIELSNYIKSFPNWARPFKDAWIVKTENKKVSTIRDELKNILGPEAQILVMDVTNNGWGTSNISKGVTNWMKEYI